MDQFLKPVRNVSPPTGKRKHKGIFAEIAAIVDGLQVDGEAKEVQVIAPDRHRVQAYFLQYVNLYIDPTDWHLRTRQEGDNGLLVWKVSGQRPTNTQGLAWGKDNE